MYALVAVEVKAVGDHVAVADIDTDGGGVQLEVLIFGVVEAHVVLRGVNPVVGGGEGDVAGSRAALLHGAVGVVALRAVDVVHGTLFLVAPDDAVGESRGAAVAVVAAAVVGHRVVHDIAVEERGAAV